MQWRDDGTIPNDRIVDSRYQDLVEDPAAAARKIYDRLDIPFSDEDAGRITAYLAFKPKHKHGVHAYRTMTPEQVARTRPYFKRYQERHNVPDEV